jgi:hypothetical protein
MLLTFNRYSFVILVLIGFLLSYFISMPYSIGTSIGLGLIFLFAHRNRKRPSTKQKHTAKRAGTIYNKVQNEKQGNKNKKYKKPDNPNKNGNSNNDIQ